MVQEFRKWGTKWPSTIISGGQLGADYGALVGAKFLGIATGGFAPKDWLTEGGPMPTLGSMFGLTQTTSRRYDVRTAYNVRTCDGCIVIASNPDSAGTKLTVNLLSKLNKPYIVIDPAFAYDYNIHAAREMLVQAQPDTLMFAGNRESVSPGIQTWTCNFARNLFLDKARQ